MPFRQKPFCYCTDFFFFYFSHFCSSHNLKTNRDNLTKLSHMLDIYLKLCRPKTRPPRSKGARGITLLKMSFFRENCHNSVTADPISSKLTANESPFQCQKLSFSHFWSMVSRKGTSNLMGRI